MSSLSASEIAFLMLAMVQAVAAVTWAIGAWWIRETRAASAHWAAYAACSTVTFLFLGTHLTSLPVAAVLIAMVGLMLLQRGVRHFTGQRRPHSVHAVMLVAAALASWVGTDLAWRPQQAVVHYTITASLYLWIALDLYRYARDKLALRWPVLMTIPLLLAGLNAIGRALRTALKPEALATEIASNSTLNVGTAMAVVAVIVMLHATLMALVVARLIQQLRWQARHDGLTGLLNRRAMQEIIDQELSRSRRAGDTFAVVMLDVDHFKALNDLHGHPAGDHALKHIAALLQTSVRDVDRVGRFGGEEFIVLLPGLSLAQAGAIAETLRQRLAAQRLQYEGAGEPLALSASFGVAEWKGPKEDPSRLLMRADQALYRAKRAGRNQVQTVDDETEFGLGEPIAA
ncbi:MAG TPA: GGDEF domain-containing protein [Burkholderiaceae bacterium]|nr:GGDEF domain-containing protein [Burkholderiaceae bacterium]